MTRTAKAVKPKPKIYKPATRKEAQAKQLKRVEGRTEGLKKEMKTVTRGKKQVLVRQFNSVTILKDFSVNTNGIDGLWGKYTVWIGSKFGVSRAKTPGYVKEYQWRTNHASEDLFELALSYMAE